ncbi:M56 family metallopeptidase [Micromonospora sp. MS34]|uniref:M56 family metallopeptidase n=1 Tax=Micromonospora sp. MS34 TaxID=3385971 RepID=UPI0039A15FB3
MSIALALVAGVVVAAWWGPVALRFCFRRVADPVAVLLGWLGLLVAVAVTFGLAVAALLAPGTAHDWALHDLVQLCWHWAQPSRPSALDDVLGVAGVLIMIAVLTKFAASCAGRARTAYRARRAHADLLTLSGGGGAGPGDAAVLWIPHPTPLAYSLGGAGGMTVLASCTRNLPADQFAAVLSHERAHLRERHHVLVSAVEGLASAVPWLPLAREAPAAVRLLVELRADTAAVRECGLTAVQGALLSFAGAPHPPSALSMAGGEVGIRLQRLQLRTPPGRVLATRAAFALAALGAPMGVGMLAAVITCL